MARKNRNLLVTGIASLVAHSLFQQGMGRQQFGVHFVEATPPPGGTGTPPADDDDKKKGKGKKIELTEEELEAKINEKLEAHKAKAKEKADKDKADAEEKAKNEKLLAEGQWKELEKKKDLEIQEANHRAMLADVNVKLRDHLTAKHPEYLANAVDIMVHIEREVKNDTKPEEVVKIIEAQAKAFVDRTPKAKPAGGLPKTPRGGSGNPVEGNPQNTPTAPARQRFSHLTRNY